MSSKVQAWRPPFTEPSGVYKTSEVIVTHTCGCARACGVLAIKHDSPTIRKTIRRNIRAPKTRSLPRAHISLQVGRKGGFWILTPPPRGRRRRGIVNALAG